MFEVKLEPADVDKFVKDALLQSSIGVHLNEAINKHLKDALSGYSSPVEKICRQFVKDQVCKIFEQENYRETIKTAIAQVVTEKFITEVIRVSVTQMQEAIERSRNY